MNLKKKNKKQINLEPTHFNCCHAPKDLGHMYGCPNSPENNSSFQKLYPDGAITAGDKKLKEMLDS
tara:strand:+ start:1614 stop:1811 length:198 start_codon:yes stop_codon:yes gene_type:complete